MTPLAPELLYCDDALCAVSKPSGLAVHKGWAFAAHYALDLVRARLQRRVYPVHRLDQPTSGLLLFALTPIAAHALSTAFAERAVHKTYLALTRGLPPPHLRLDHPLKGEDGTPEPAITTFTHLWTLANRYALVACSPETGRTHQIRRHLKHLSCPIIGDTSYGKSEHNRRFATLFGLRRLALHALTLTFPHPTTGLALTLHAPLPDDLRLPLRAMGCPRSLLIASRAGSAAGATVSSNP